WASHAGFRLTVPVVAGAAAVVLCVEVEDASRSRVAVATILVQPRLSLPLVSVIVPVFNQAHYLSESLGSIAAQTYSAVEVIAVNDGSHDNASKAARR